MELIKLLIKIDVLTEYDSYPQGDIWKFPLRSISATDRKLLQLALTTKELIDISLLHTDGTEEIFTCEIIKFSHNVTAKIVKSTLVDFSRDRVVEEADSYGDKQ